MKEQETNQSQSATAKDATRERCLCYEVLDLFRSRVHASPRVRQHLANSRIEFLKAIRQVLDERIEHLSQPSRQGTKITVE